MKKLKQAKMFTVPDNVRYVIGLDLSLTCTGFAAADIEAGGRPQWGTIEGKNLRECERLDYIESNLRALVQYPDQTMVVVEGFSFASKGAAVFEMGGLGWIVRLALWRMHVPYVVVSPMSLKKFVLGKATSEKALVIREIWRRWSYEVDDDNIADALVLLEIGRAMLSPGRCQMQAQREVLETLGVPIAAALGV